MQENTHYAKSLGHQLSTLRAQKGGGREALPVQGHMVRQLANPEIVARPGTLEQAHGSVSGNNQPFAGNIRDAASRATGAEKHMVCRPELVIPGVKGSLTGILDNGVRTAGIEHDAGGGEGKQKQEKEQQASGFAGIRMLQMTEGCAKIAVCVLFSQGHRLGMSSLARKAL